MAEASDRSCAPKPAISKDQLTQLVTSNGWHRELTMIAPISLTFLLRVPSERLLVRRQRAEEDLIPDDRMDKKAAIGLSEGQLVI